MRVLVTLLFAALACWGQTGTLKTKVNPGRAGVFVDGKYVGPAANFGMARTYTLTAGEHEVKLTDPRYEDVVRKVTINAGKKTTITESLKPLPVPQPPFARLRTINPDKFAAVYVNGKYMGHVDEFSNFAQTLMLPPGSYEVKIEPSTGGAPIVKTVTLEADKTTIVQ